MYKREYIDFAYLAGNARRAGIKEAIEQAIKYKPRGLCLNTVAVDTLKQDDEVQALFDQFIEAEILRQFTIDFPLGQGGSDAKMLVAEDLIIEGLVDEFDVVANVGYIIGNDRPRFNQEMSTVIGFKKPVKIIVETGYYASNPEILERAVHWCAGVGAFAIKTSTGFIKNISNSKKLEHIALFRAIIDREDYSLKIKDAGGKQSREDIDNSIAAGAHIVGTTSVIL